MHNNSEITKVEQLLKDSDITKPLVNYVHIAFMLGYEKQKKNLNASRVIGLTQNQISITTLFNVAYVEARSDYSKDNYCQACGAKMEEEQILSRAALNNLIVGAEIVEVREIHLG